MNNRFVEFLQNKGLYDSIPINQTNIDELCDLIGGKVKLSEYCTICKEKRVFSMTPIEFLFPLDDGKRQLRTLATELISNQNVQKMVRTPHPGLKADESDWYWTNWQTENGTRVMVFSYSCAMDENHRIDYIVKTEGNKFIKIGQFPSIADLAFPELDELKKNIDEQTRKEFRRAIGLHAQGIGVGSYVYLRRIFEKILEEAKKQAQTDGAVDLSNYDKMRVADRIKLLKDYLPDIINSNPTIYGIVSKGIHELSEEGCIQYFPVLKEAILMILRQWAQKRKEQEAIKTIESSISTIATELL